MKAVISSTYDSKYLFFLPITTFLWNKLGVNVICFMPNHENVAGANPDKLTMIVHTCMALGLNLRIEKFKCPEHKEATYAQCSRLYGACLDLPEDEVLITSDVDMGVFKNIFTPNHHGSYLTIIGNDLVPEGQYPICYAYGTVHSWINSMNINNKTYQQCLDELLGDIEADHFRGNYWGKDQETLFNKLQDDPKWLTPRARPGTQFAANRVDRDDINWRAYVNDYLVDAHLWRPGYTEENFANIMELLTMKYPQEDFTWLVDYNNAYKQLL